MGFLKYIWDFLKNTWGFLNVNDGALMVIITFVYAIATFYICKANIKSASATKAQLEESQREHEENMRLSFIPFLQFEAYDAFSERDYDLELEFPLFRHNLCNKTFSEIMRLTNIGNGAATNIVYSWSNKEYGVSIADTFRVNAIKKDGEYRINLVFGCFGEKINPKKPYVLTLQYDDMRGYTYEQKMIFSFYSSGECSFEKTQTMDNLS